MFQGSFFFSVIWACGGALNSHGRQQFSLLFRGLLEKAFPEDLAKSLNLPEPVPPPAKKYNFTIPTEGSVFDYRFIKEVRSINLVLPLKL